MINNGLLANEVTCRTCGTPAKLGKRQRSKDGYTFRCLVSKHEYGMRKNSFLEGSAYNIRELMIFFIKYYLEGNSLHQCALATGMDYWHTAVDWGSFIRDLFCQYVHDSYGLTMCEGNVELDDSLFGQKIKK